MLVAPIKMSAKELLLQPQIPQYQWQNLGIDLFYQSGKQFLVTIDYYSRHFEIDELGTNTYTDQIIERLKQHFSRFGIPHVLSSDNEPQFTSGSFKTFLKEWGIHHTTYSPNYPQSNRLAEKAVSIAKGIIKKSQLAKTDLQMAFLEYRNTPVE
jgi:hypothetical protein